MQELSIKNYRMRLIDISINLSGGTLVNGSRTDSDFTKEKRCKSCLRLSRVRLLFCYDAIYQADFHIYDPDMNKEPPMPPKASQKLLVYRV